MKNLFPYTEFFTNPEGQILVSVRGQAPKVLTECDRGFITDMLRIIENRYPKAYKRLSEIYHSSRINRCHYEYKMVRRFLACNFGEYDQCSFDVDEDGALRFEEVRCPLRGECKHEGVICKPKFHTCLTYSEIEVLRMMAEDLTSENIGRVLCVSTHTVKKHRHNMMKKTGLSTGTGLVGFFYKNIKK